jgi:cytochrome P450
MRSYLLPFIMNRAVYSNAGEHKTILDLAIKAYAKEVQGTSKTDGIIDPSFADALISHLKMFIFAGHDTTASTLSFIYHMLHLHPETLAKMREEHDAVMGTDRTEAAQKIRESPQLLNQLPYTLACIKETLRLCPPAGSVRQGQPGFFLTHPESGVKYPTENFMLFSCSTAVHRMAEFWPRPDDFVPERFLAREGDPMYVMKNTFRAFELGPRNCIGQELARQEMICVLALTIRDFDVQSVYPEDGPRMFGDLAYQLLSPGDVTNHPNLGMPVRVKIRE